jgi:hypothetical protein
MDNAKLIHRILKQIDWDFVLLCARKLDSSKVKTTKADLIADLQLAIQNVIETNKNIVVIDLWVVHCDQEGEDLCIEAVFTPLVACADTFPSRNSKESKIAKIKNKIDLALEIENYEEATRLRKSMEVLQTKKKTAI